MKNKIYIISSILVFVFVFLIVRAIGISYSAPNEGENYYYIRRNMLSHHYITANSGNESGTILIKTGNKKSDSGEATLVYCARQGKNISGSAYSKENLSSAGYTDSQEKKLKAMLSLSYPYITLAELKETLKDPDIGIGEDYASLHFEEKFDVQEAMTATQASVWNIIKNTTTYKYKTTKKIGAVYYNQFGRINWDKIESYAITGRGGKSTILQDGDTAESVGSYNTDSDVGKRINALITWYLNLSTANIETNDYIPSFDLEQLITKWESVGKTYSLTIAIKPSGEFDFSNSSYQVTFNDLNGNLIPEANITSTVITENGVTTGYKYNITGITTKGVNAKVVATKASVPKDVYFYKTANGSGQHLIGMDSGNVEVINNIPVIYKGDGKIIVYKTDEGETKLETTTTSNLKDYCGSSDKPCLDGAYMALYASDKVTIINRFITTTSPYVIENLPNGTYYLKELSAPIGYDLNNTWLEIKVEGEEVVHVRFLNDPTYVCFNKVSSEDNTVIVDGAKFRVENASGSAYEEFETSSQQGKYCLKGQLEPGYYYLVETEAPKNYVKSNKKYKFSVGTFDPEDIVEELEESETVVLVENKNNTVTIENTPGTVITKSDLATGACVEGAKLVIKDSDSKVVDEWTSSCKDGLDSHQIGLQAGTYTLTEEIAPSGYATAETIKFTIDKNGKVDKSLDMKDAPIEACFLKVSSDSEEGLVGAEFEIYKEDGTLYDSFTTDYTATCFQYMPVGTYKLKEIKAPEGYQLLEDEITINVKDTADRQVFEIENELKVPTTDLDSSKLFVIVSILFTIFGLGLVGYYAYKKQN